MTGCRPEAPCGGILYEVLVCKTFTIWHCLNGHRYRVGAPPPPYRGAYIVHERRARAATA
jgi:hypothetical protein